MEKKKSLRKSSTLAQWPKAAVLEEMRSRLSSPDVEGSTVFGPDAPLADRIKQDLCSKIVRYHLKTQISQKDLASRLGVDEPEMSRILHYKIERYTIDRLVGYLQILYPHVRFEVSAA